MPTSANASARVRVEVAVDSVAGARAAESAGADRIELCTALSEGGLTPTIGLLQECKRAVRLPVVAMLRPRAGDFLYDTAELAVMQRDLAHLAAHGADGIAVGVLTRDGDLDPDRMKELAAAAAPLPLTCHRAFDLVRDPMRALAQLVDLGIARVLTSGQATTAVDGATTIAALVAAAAARIEVIAGAGVRANNVRDLARRTLAPTVHLSATVFVDSAMRHRNAAATMATQPPRGDYALRRTDGDEVARVVAALRGD